MTALRKSAVALAHSPRAKSGNQPAHLEASEQANHFDAPIAPERQANDPTGGAGSASIASPKPYGNQPICPGCNRGALYSCICDPFPEEDDVTPVDVMKRIMPELFDGSTWLKAEQAALEMRHG